MLSAKNLFIVIGLLITSHLSAQYNTVFKIPFPSQYRVMDSIVDKISYFNAINASVAFDELDKAARQTNNEQCILNLKRAFLQYRYIISHELQDTAYTNKLIRDAEDLLKQTDEKKYPEIAAMIHITIGNTGYYKIHRYDLAFEHYDKAYDLFKNLPPGTFPGMQYAQYAIALAYYQFNDYKNAIALAKDIEAASPDKNYISIFTVDMIGMCYMKLQQYDSAIANFQWVLDNINYANRTKAWEGIATGNIGNVYFLEGQFDKALPYLEQGVNLTLEENIPDNTANFAAWASTIYSKQQNIPIAKKYLEIAQQCASRANSAFNYYTLYKAMADFYKQAGDTKMALMFLDSSVHFKDSLAKINEVNLKYQKEIAVEIQRKNHEEKMHEERRSKQMLIRNGIIILSSILIILILLFYIRRKQKNTPA